MANIRILFDSLNVDEYLFYKRPSFGLQNAANCNAKCGLSSCERPHFVLLLVVYCFTYGLFRREVHAKVVHYEAVDVGLFLEHLAHGFASSVARLAVDAY